MSVQMMQQETGAIVAASKLHMAHPGAAALASGIYASSASALQDLAMIDVARGRTRSAPNSVSFGAQSQFTIVPGSVMGNAWLSASIAVPNYCTLPDGWLLNAIDTIDVVIAGNSSVQNGNLTGESHFDLVMAACRTKEKRDAILACSPGLAGGAASATTVYGSCPLYLYFSSANNGDKFPLDTSTLKGNVILNIKWKPFYNVCSGITGQAVASPTAFASLELVLKQTNLLQDAFKMSRAINANSSLSYFTPTNAVQSFQRQVAVTQNVQSSVTIDSLPKGQLVAIMVKFRNVNSYGDSTTTAYPIRPEGVLFQYINLKYNGSDVIKYTSENEIRLVRAIETDGDGYRYGMNVQSAIAAGTLTAVTGEVCVLPLTLDLMEEMNSKKMQSLPQYGGSVFEFHFKTNAATGNYIATFTFMFNSILDINASYSNMII